jgi:ribose transport system permease protein
VTTTRAEQSRTRRIAPERYATLLFFFALYIVIIALHGGQFLSSGNLSVVIQQNAYLAFLAAAVTCTLIAGEFDLSAGPTAGLAAILTVYLTVNKHLGTGAAVVIVLAVGALCGLVNGVLVIGFRINAFIATLGSGGVYAGVALWVSGGKTLFGAVPASLTHPMSATWDKFPVAVVYVIVLLLIMWALTKRTIAGRRWYAIGANAEASQLAGIKVRRMKMLAFLFTGVLSGLSGVLYTASFASADPTLGGSLLLPAFAAAFLGSSILSDGRFSMAGSVIGCLLIVYATNGLSVAGLDSYALEIFNGIVLVAAVGFTELLRRRPPLARRRSTRLAGSEPPQTQEPPGMKSGRPDANEAVHAGESG